jgi:hypothetical protein
VQSNGATMTPASRTECQSDASCQESLVSSRKNDGEVLLLALCRGEAWSRHAVRESGSVDISMGIQSTPIFDGIYRLVFLGRKELVHVAQFAEYVHEETVWRTTRFIPTEIMKGSLGRFPMD